ncbi:alpha amylase N-terminal ig-like domain-containing protein [Peribacillus frigoritolerans]|nr:alpha amylase N-terminal ig-like domain-containing protein [Peribacillus frigoritolerans]
MIFGDPYISNNGQWQYEELPMSLSGSDTRYDYWHIYVKPPYRRIRYGFKVSAEEDAPFTRKRASSKSLPEIPDAISRFLISIKMKFSGHRNGSKIQFGTKFSLNDSRTENPANDPEGVKPWGSEEPAVDNFFWRGLRRNH